MRNSTAAQFKITATHSRPVSEITAFHQQSDVTTASELRPEASGLEVLQKSVFAANSARRPRVSSFGSQLTDPHPDLSPNDTIQMMEEPVFTSNPTISVTEESVFTSNPTDTVTEESVFTSDSMDSTPISFSKSLPAMIESGDPKNLPGSEEESQSRSMPEIRPRKNKRKATRSGKCNDENCVPCSVTSNCNQCYFCLNRRSLK